MALHDKEDRQTSKYARDVLRILSVHSRRPGHFDLPQTSCAVAAKKGIQYVGIDISANAQEVISRRFTSAGFPAPRLIGRTGFTIQMNVNRHIKFHNNKDKGADGGIDGYCNYKLPNGTIVKALSSIKSGGASLSHFRDFCHVITRDRADLGIFIMRDAPTNQMLLEQTKMGYYNNNPETPKLQIYTIDDIINDKVFVKTPEGAMRE